MHPLNFDPFPGLSTGKLLLRRMTEEDAPEVFFLRSAEEVMRYIDREPARSVEDAIQHIRKINELIGNNESVLWAIAFADEPSRLVGTICLWNFDIDNSRTDIGYVLHPEHWGKGIMKAAIQAVTDYGFQQLGLHSIAAEVSPGNIASCRVLESTGYKQEGYLKENIFSRGQYLDTVLYACINPSHQTAPASS